MDGVLVDSMPLHTQAWIQYLEPLGIPPERVLNRMHGKRNDELVRDLFGADLAEEEVHAHGAAKEALYRDLAAAQLPRMMVPGVARFIEMHEALPKAVASNAERANLDFVLEGSGLKRYFRAVVDGHQVERPKPHPDIYLEAARRLESAPADCIVFEDSPTGIRAGLAAGMRVVAVNTLGLADLGPVDLVIEHFEDPALPAWLSKQQLGMP
jgi:HAD superfamily hydrolase (TIGR01509 family)